MQCKETPLKTMQSVAQDAWSYIAEAPPLDRMVATPPLRGLETQEIDTALDEAATLFEMKILPRGMEAVNRDTIYWCSAFFDRGQATLSMPYRELGLYAAWRRLSGNTLRPASAEAALAAALEALCLPRAQYGLFLRLLLTTLPGWAAFVKEDGRHQSDYLALRCALCVEHAVDPTVLLDIYQTILQQKRGQKLLEQLRRNETRYQGLLLPELVLRMHGQRPRAKPDAQLLFCIDVRSEPMRRGIEAEGNYSTYGCAGFFGLPIELYTTDTGSCRSSCPAIVSPLHRLAEKPLAARPWRWLRGVYQSLKDSIASPVALVETLGPVAAVLATLRTLWPHTLMERRSHPHSVDAEALPFDARVSYASGLLRSIGLIRDFAKHVVVCGHEACTENNAFASALNCGACGGHSGRVNAELLCQILNDPKLRAVLKNEGILIPEQTCFVPAVHCTTTQRVTLAQQDGALQKLQTDLDRVHEALRPERATHKNWAETRPEWGLARCGALIVGPRQLTETLDLDARCFLHSYDWRLDRTGNLLAGILSGPGIVAHWINAQYNYSTINPIAYGSGSKVTQNVVGKHGVMQGNASDRMHGLPMQSCNSTDGTPYHVPLRLMIAVHCPREQLLAALELAKELRQLVHNGWLQLACLDPETLSLERIDRETLAECKSERVAFAF